MPNYYAFNVAFWLKMLALLLLGLNAAAFYLTDAFHSVEHLGPGEDAPPSRQMFRGDVVGPVVCGDCPGPLHSVVFRHDLSPVAVVAQRELAAAAVLTFWGTGKTR